MKVAVLGYGTVGVGVHEMLQQAQNLEAGPVLVRPGKKDTDYKVESIEAILSDSSVEAMAEAMGGIEIPGAYAKQCIQAGKHFVTANKALVVAQGPELARLAQEKGVGFLFSAACGGAVPFLHNLSIASQSDTIEKMSGILNGSTNYMLDAMQRRGSTYEEIMAEAKSLGYLEADPSADVSGLDALRKILLACAVAYGQLPGEDSEREGIENITAEDVKDIQQRGYTCRLMTRGGKVGDSIYACVEPALLPPEHPGSAVYTNYNMASYQAKNAGPISFVGQGAGRYPTASALLRDLSCIVTGKKVMMPADTKRVAADNSLCVHPYYIRIKDSQEQRYISEPISVKEMHKQAALWRQDGKKVFFAALGE